MKKTSLSVQKDITSAYRCNYTLQNITDEVGVSKATVSRVLKHADIKIIPQPKKPKRKLSVKKEITLSRKFADKELSFASEGCKWLKDNFNLSVSGQTIKKPALEDRRILDRKKFARLHLNFFQIGAK